MYALLVFAVSVAVVQGACPSQYSQAGSMCVRPYSISSTFPEAYKLCNFLGSELAAPTNSGQSQALTNYVNSLPDVEGDFFIHRPDLSGPCRALIQQNGYDVASVSCAEPRFFLCQVSA